jgi:hypothetical protein
LSTPGGSEIHTIALDAAAPSPLTGGFSNAQKGTGGETTASM